MQVSGPIVTYQASSRRLPAPGKSRSIRSGSAATDGPAGSLRRFGCGRLPAVRFVVLGAGAIGGVVGGRLFQQGYDVTLVARGDHGHALGNGLVLESAEATVTLPVDVVAEPSEVTWSDDVVVLMGVKGQDTDRALSQLMTVVPSETPVVCTQNGVENERRVLRRFPNTYGMCVMCPATYLRAGRRPGPLHPGHRSLGPGPIPGWHRCHRPGHCPSPRCVHLPVGREGGHHAVEVPETHHESGKRHRGAVRTRGASQPPGRGGEAGR